MTIRQFLIDICGIFLSVSLASSIEELIKGFSLLALFSFVVIFFLSVNFFFAKVKQLNEETEVITTSGFFLNISTLACFAAMPFLMNHFTAFMGVQLGLRISDLALIFNHNHWDLKKIGKMEMRWILFDVIYFLIIVGFILAVVYIDFPFLDVIFMAGYLIMGVFESLFDFLINQKHYGMATDNAADNTFADTNEHECAAKE